RARARSRVGKGRRDRRDGAGPSRQRRALARARARDRKSTRLNSSHLVISYAVFCLKKKKLYCPLIWILQRSTNFVLRLLWLEPAGGETHVHSQPDLRLLLNVSAEPLELERG